MSKEKEIISSIFKIGKDNKMKIDNRIILLPLISQLKQVNIIERIQINQIDLKC